MPLPVDAETALAGVTEGVPLYVVEYLEVMTKRGQAEGDVEVPSVIRSLLRSRVSAVSGLARQLLGAAAVIGRSFDHKTLREASGRSEEEAVTALEELIGQGLIREDQGAGPGGPSYDFAHERLREFIYDDTTFARRRLLHRRAADALTARATQDGRRGHLASQIARHYRLAGRDTEAAGHYVSAGEYARSLFANDEALEMFRSALALGSPDASGLHEAIGDLQTLSGEYAAAIASYETAAASGEPTMLATLEHKLGNVHHRRGDWDLAASYYESANSAAKDLADSTSARARIRADQSLNAHRSGQAALAESLAQEALDLSDASDDPGALAQAHNIMGVMSKHRGRLESARHHLERSLSLAASLDDPAAKVAALNNLSLTHAAAGEHDRAIELAREALRLCSLQGDRHREAAIHNNLADFHHQTGRSEAAVSHLTQAALIFADVGSSVAEMQPEIWKLVDW